MKGLSKSKYTLFCQYPKALWLRTYSCQSWSPPPLLRTRHLGNGEGVGETERNGRNNLNFSCEVTILGSNQIK